MWQRFKKWFAATSAGTILIAIGLIAFQFLTRRKAGAVKKTQEQLRKQISHETDIISKSEREREALEDKADSLKEDVQEKVKQLKEKGNEKTADWIDRWNSSP